MNLSIFGKEYTIKKPVLAVIIVFLVFIVWGLGVLINRNNKIVFTSNIMTTDNIQSTAVPTSAAASTQAAVSVAAESVQEEIKVYITGCVNKRGIVTLKKGQMIDDAIRAAGGATKDADLENINLVYVLNENTMLKIRSKFEKPEVNTASEAKASAKTGGNASQPGKGAVIVKDSGGAVVNAGSIGSQTSGKVNINTATAEELDTLPYIGKETAKDIIEYREKHGKFKTTSDIMKVSGIKESRYGKIKGLITV